MNLIKKIILLMILPYGLHATVPEWSFDGINNGWNSNSLAKLYFHYSETQRQWAWELLGKHRFNGNEKILDFGCGDGKISAEMSRFVPKGSVTGVDLSKEMLHLARLKFPGYAYSNLSYQQSDSFTFANFSVKEGSYDVITSFAVFHLVKEPLETLKNLKKHLKPKGKLLLVIPNGTNPTVYRAANEIFAKYQLETPWSTIPATEPKTMRTMEGCTYFLSEAGFRILSIELVDTENAFFDIDELVVWMMGTVTANWNVPVSVSRSFFTDLVHRMYEMDPQMIDEEGRVRFKMPRLHVIAEPT